MDAKFSSDTKVQDMPPNSDSDSDYMTEEQPTDPEHFTHIEQFSEYIHSNLSKSAFSYLQSAADDEITLKRNLSGFENFCIRPRVLCGDMGQIDTGTSLLGSQISMPICVAPTGYQRIYHNDGEIANAKACAAMNTVWTMSTLATRSIPEVAKAVSSNSTPPKWLQVYVFKTHEVTARIVRRAVENGFKALVLTVDATVPGRKRAALKHRLFLPPPFIIPNLEDKADYSKDLVTGAGEAFDQTLNWNAIKWLKSISGLPVVVKGIQTAADAKLAVENGADAIWVSNHGGRQIDYGSATICILTEVVNAVNGSCEIYIDGGFRSGAEVFIALALGARAVFVGRPVIWGLTCFGEDGVRRVLDILRTELRSTMGIAGCKNLTQITRSHVGRYPTSKI